MLQSWLISTVYHNFKTNRGRVEGLKREEALELITSFSWKGVVGRGEGLILERGLIQDSSYAFKRENVLRSPIYHFCVREQSQLTKLEFFFILLCSKAS